MRLAIVIPTHQTRELTLGCLSSLHAVSGEPTSIVVVDDGSSDGTAEAVRHRFPDVQVLRNEIATGFTAAANRGIESCRSELVLLLNSDTEVLSGSMTALLAAFRLHPRLGVAGASLLYPDGSRQWSAGAEPGLLWCFATASGLGPRLGRQRWYRRWRDRRTGSSVSTLGEYQPTAWVTGAALALRKEVWTAVGPLYEGFRFYAQDLDFCLRAREAGWQVGVVPSCRIVHHHGATLERRDASAQVERQNPALLWPDLVRWAARRSGPRRARRMAQALAAGARCRLATRRLVALFRPGRRNAEWRRVDEVLTRGLETLTAMDA